MCGLDENAPRHMKWVSIMDASKTFEMEVSGTATLNRGHNAPNGDMMWDKAAQHGTFGIDANACPQEGHMNAHAWMCSEKVIHEYATEVETQWRSRPDLASLSADQRHEVNVLTGPMVCPKLFGAPGRMGGVECTSDKCHGGNVIPHMFWKVIVDADPAASTAQGWGYLALNWCTEDAMSVSQTPLSVAEVRDFVAWCENRDPAAAVLFGAADSLGVKDVPASVASPALCRDDGPTFMRNCGVARNKEKCRRNMEMEGDGRGDLIWKHCCSQNGHH